MGHALLCGVQIAKHNLRSRAFLHARMWVKSLIEYMSQKVRQTDDRHQPGRQASRCQPRLVLARSEARRPRSDMGCCSMAAADGPQNNSVTGDKDIGLMYRATVSIRNFFDLKRYSRAVRHLIPQPPITGGWMGHKHLALSSRASRSKLWQL